MSRYEPSMTLIRHHILTLRLRVDAPFPSQRRAGFHAMRCVK